MQLSVIKKAVSQTRKSVRLSMPRLSEKNITMKPIPYVGTMPKKYKSYIRDKAIDRARTRIIVAGNNPRTMSQEDLEVVVKEEEDKIKGSIREKGLMAVLALLGLNLFV